MAGVFSLQWTGLLVPWLVQRVRIEGLYVEKFSPTLDSRHKNSAMDLICVNTWTCHLRWEIGSQLQQPGVNYQRAIVKKIIIFCCSWIVQVQYDVLAILEPYERYIKGSCKVILQWKPEFNLKKDISHTLKLHKEKKTFFSVALSKLHEFDCVLCLLVYMYYWY